MIKAVPFSALIFEPATFGPNNNADFVPGANELAFVPSLKKLVFVIGEVVPYVYHYVEVQMVPQQYYYHTHTQKLYQWNDATENLVEVQIPEGNTPDPSNMLVVVDSICTINDQFPNIEQGAIVVFRDNGKFVGLTITGLNNQIVTTSDNVIFEGCEFKERIIRNEDNEITEIIESHFCYSNLKATNFGCKAGIASRYLTYEEEVEGDTVVQNGWRYNNLGIYNYDPLTGTSGYQAIPDVLQYYGSDGVDDNINNTAALNSIAQFCSGSDHIRIEFNGDFFSAFDTQNNKIHPITINAATNLELCGSVQPTLSALRIKDENGDELVAENAANDAAWATLKRLVTGISLKNCSHVCIHHLNFIGLHSGHKFPPRYFSSDSFSVETERGKLWALKLGSSNVQCSIGGASVTINGEGYTAADCYTGTDNGDTSVGLSIRGVTVWTDADGTSDNVNVHDCNFSMRCNAVVFGFKNTEAFHFDTDSGSWINSVSDCAATNCRCDNTYWQPIAFHCTSGYAKDFYIDGCGQAIDISTLSNCCKVENVVAKNCGAGPKQEAENGLIPSVLDENNIPVPGRFQNPGDLEWRHFTHDNVLRNCDIEITDESYTVDTEEYILRVARGAANSHFLMEGCKFTVNSRKKTFVGLMLEDENVTIRDTEFFIDVQTKWNLVSNVGILDGNAVVNNEYLSRYLYTYQTVNGQGGGNNYLNTDIPKLFYGDKWHGSERTSLALDNVIVHMSQNTSVEKAFSDLKNLYARDLWFNSWDGGDNNTLIVPETSSTSHLRKIYMYLYKIQSSQFRNCKFTALKAHYFAHSFVTHLSMTGSNMGNIMTFGFNYQTALNGSSSLTLELMSNQISDVATLIFYNKTSRLFDLYCRDNSISASCFLQGKLEPDTGGGTGRTILDMPPRIHIVNNQINITYTEAFRFEQGFASLLQDKYVNISENTFVGNRKVNNVGVENDLLLPFTNAEVDKEDLRAAISHLFWNNTISGTMNRIDTGTIGCRPLYPSEGMVFHAVDNNEVVTHYMCMLNEWVEVRWTDDGWVRVQEVDMD